MKKIDVLDESRSFSKEYRAMRERAKNINDEVLKKENGFNAIWCFKRLVVINGERENSCAYVIILRKDYYCSFIARVRRFYKLFKASLQEGERLLTDNECFTIRGKGYSIMYCIEGYKENSDRIGFVSKRSVYGELMRRTPSGIAMKWYRIFSESEKEKMDSLMKSAEWIEQYPNPAQRYAIIARRIKDKIEAKT